MKASFEAINLGLQTHEFAIGRELVGLSGSSDGLSSLPSTPTTQNQKRKKTQKSDVSLWSDQDYKVVEITHFTVLRFYETIARERVF